jgi:hypothetical protein
MCILSSASIFMFLSPRRFRSFVRMLSKVLKSLWQDAELAEMDSMRLARRMKDGGSRSDRCSGVALRIDPRDPIRQASNRYRLDSATVKSLLAVIGGH